MDPRFQANNTHLFEGARFGETDPHLKRLYQQPYVYASSIIQEMPRNEPGILSLTGGRQVGKTTLLKQWMEDLLKAGADPQALCFFSGELIGDHQNLYTLMTQQLSQMPKTGLRYFVVDEVTDIENWDKTVKYLADTGELENTILVLSGSDSVLIQEARKRFPGRRGRAPQVDFHYYPLSFRECSELKKTPQALPELYQGFREYLIHGGFLTAINEFAQTQSISGATLAVYSDWIRGDVLKRGKKEIFLKEIMGAIVKHYLKQVSWDNLVKELSIDHVQTVSNYIELLESMDAVFVQSAIVEEQLRAAPKKRKKLMFPDPFIYHAVRAWLDPVRDPFHSQIEPLLSEPEGCSELVEAAVIAHFRRFYPTYYIKAEGEVDVAYVRDHRFWPVEVKWTEQLRVKDLKQIKKYKNAEIYAKIQSPGDLDGIPLRPLPLALLGLA